MKKTRVVVIDDHPLIRSGVRTCLEAQPDFVIAGEAKDGLEAVQLFDRLHPDVAVLDLALPGLDGLDVILQARQRSPQTRLVVLTMRENAAYVIRALRNGASAYILKRSPPDELVEAIRETADGQLYLSRALLTPTLESLLRQPKPLPVDPYDGLTPRERQVLHLAAEGLTSTEIADRLVISPRTVEGHRSNLMHKLGLKNQSDLVRYAVARGIVPPDSDPP